ncbi:AAA family ATPase [Parabacteroides distasonis]|uniref:AAA family ATPase n=1 Tax=Parabacteroides distasonis TaxID=823 RepID=UPI001C3D50B2
MNAIKDNTLILLDEPENSLSTQCQMGLALFLQGAIRSFNFQLIIASHSPFILSIPGSKIYNLDVTPIEIDKWYNLNNIRCYFDLFKQHETYFEK